MLIGVNKYKTFVQKKKTSIKTWIPLSLIFVIGCAILNHDHIYHAQPKIQYQTTKQ